MKKSCFPWVVAALAVMLAGCAVQHVPATLAAMSPASAVLSTAAVITLDTGYTRVLNSGSRWLVVGTVAQGTVHKPVGDVFTLEGSHIHEAWLVLDQGRLVGFYLPAERGFSPLATPVPLSFN